MSTGPEVIVILWPLSKVTLTCISWISNSFLFAMKPLDRLKSIYIMSLHDTIRGFNAALTLWRISLRIWKFEIRGKFVENDKIVLEKYWKSEALWMLAKFLRILANFCESITNKANGLRLFWHFLENALRMCANSLPTLASTCTCKCLRMTYKHKDCLENALLIPSDFHLNIAHSTQMVSLG